MAAGIIGGVTALQREGFLPRITTTGVSQTYVSSSQSTTQGSTSTNGQGGGAGSLILLLHDPPNVPLGVSAVFVTFSGISIHAAGSYGWIELNQTGSTINLMSVVNFTQTIANIKLREGSFDMLRMNLSLVIVTFDSKNYTASIPSAYLVAPIIGDLQVQNLETAGAVIDVSPTIIEHTSYNSTGISFSMIPSARAYVVPSSQLSDSHLRVGDREDIGNENWLTTAISGAERETSFRIASAALSNTSFYITIRNTGNTSVLIESIFIVSNASEAHVEKDDGVDIGSSSVLFAVLSNGSLYPFANHEVEEDSSQSGHAANFAYNLSAHSSITLSYVGQIPPPTATNGTSGVDEGDSTYNMIGVQTNTSYNGFEDTLSGVSTLSADSPNGFSNSDQASNLDGGSGGMQIIGGHSYLVGVISGGITITTNVTAA